MLMTENQRPGVYSGYTVEGLYAAPRSQQFVAVVLAGHAQTAGTLHHFTGREAIADTLGQEEDKKIAACVEQLLDGGVPRVVVSAVNGKAAAALALLEGAENIAAVVSDISGGEDSLALRTFLERESENQREKIAFVGATGTAAQVEAAAKAMNHARVCLCYPAATAAGGTEADSIYGAAAMACAVLIERDPVYNWNGHRLEGLSHCEKLPEAEVQDLLAAGVTVLEEKAQAVRCIRAMTSKSATNGAADSTMRSLNTVLIIDEVMKSLRDTLQVKMAGRRLSPDSIRTQAAVVLAEKQEEGLLEGFAVPEVSAAPENPAVCVVKISFRAAQVLSQIHIVAHINI